MLLENKELTSEYHYILEGLGFLRDCHLTQQDLFTGFKPFLGPRIQEFFMEALNLYFEIQGLQIMCVQTPVLGISQQQSHLLILYLSTPLPYLPCQHTLPSLGEYRIMTQQCNLKKLTKVLS